MANKLIYASDARRAILKEDPKLAYCIDEIPGVDAVEVVHGRWIEDAIERKDEVSLRMYECTECSGIVYHHKFNYCPNCGADMRGEEDGK